MLLTFPSISRKIYFHYLLECSFIVERSKEGTWHYAANVWENRFRNTSILMSPPCCALYIDQRGQQWLRLLEWREVEKTLFSFKLASKWAGLSEKLWRNINFALENIIYLFYLIHFNTIYPFKCRLEWRRVLRGRRETTSQKFISRLIFFLFEFSQLFSFATLLQYIKINSDTSLSDGQAQRKFR